MTSLFPWQQIVFVDITDGDFDAKYQMVTLVYNPIIDAVSNRWILFQQNICN